jgi:endonuclease/exonuclease/phosphatase family metal-dependent hydrolase
LVLAAIGLVVVVGRLGNSSHDKPREGVVPSSSMRAFPEHASKGKKKGKGKKDKVKAHEVPDSPFFSLAACDAYVSAHPRAAQRGPRIGTWNVRWFPLGTEHGDNPDRKTDVPWLACTIASMDVDVIAVQEFVQSAEGRSATQDLLAQLDKLTKGHWRSGFDDCPGQNRQHVGFLYDESRVQVSHAQDVAGLNPGKNACDKNLRPGFGMYARFKDGPDLNLVSVHFDSGQTERDLDNRKASLLRLGETAKALSAAEHDADLLVLGDFNTMGCTECDPKLESAAELDSIDTQLEPIALRRVPLAKMKTECTEYENKGKEAKQIDLVLASTQMEEVAADAHLELFGVCKDLTCHSPYNAEHPAALDHLSDHCPLVLELAAKDIDAPAGKTAAPKQAATAPAPAAAAPAKAIATAPKPVAGAAPPAAAAKMAVPKDAPPKEAAAN